MENFFTWTNLWLGVLTFAFAFWGRHVRNINSVIEEAVAHMSQMHSQRAQFIEQTLSDMKRDVQTLYEHRLVSTKVVASIEAKLGALEKELADWRREIADWRVRGGSQQ